jgi:O-antigen/teichoic acid export membrane protein
MSMRATGLRGAAWIGATLALTKPLTLLTQLALGWLLVEQDFALFGIAISLTILTSSLADGGVQKFLRQQPHRYRELVGSATATALLFATAAAAILVSLALFSPRLYDTDAVRPLVLIIAINFMLTAPAAVLRSRLYVDLRFRTVALIDAILMAFRAGLTVTLAWAGFGPFALVIPIPATTLLEILLNLACGGGRDWNLSGAGATGVRVVFRTTRWIMLAAACSAIVSRGDYLVLGLMAEAILGTYFFGFQLVVSVLMLVTSSAAAVLLPTLARLHGEPERLAAAWLRTVRVSTFVIAPASAGLFLLLPIGMHVAWAGRWDAAIPVATLVALSAAVRGVATTTASGLEAGGHWRMRAGLELLEGLTLVSTVAATVALLGPDLLAIAVAVAAHRTLLGAVHIAVSGRVLGVGAGRALRICLGLAVPAMAIAVSAQLVANALLPELHPGNAAIRVGVLAIGWGAATIVLGRPAFRELQGLLPSRRTITLGSGEPPRSPA